eukprot:Filipodium_phascolosomae@DN2289_c0_g1_i3.p1
MKEYTHSDYSPRFRLTDFDTSLLGLRRDYRTLISIHQAFAYAVDDNCAGFVPDGQPRFGLNSDFGTSVQTNASCAVDDNCAGFVPDGQPRFGLNSDFGTSVQTNASCAVDDNCA